MNYSKKGVVNILKKGGGGSHFYWTTGHLTIKRVGKDCTSLY